jgi:hypothetical protein
MIADAAHQVLAPVRRVRMRGMWERRTRVDQIKKADEFAALHVKGEPVILYNAWDAGSAKAIIGAGAKAIATSSWSVAAALGYEDGEDLPLSLAEHVIRGIVTTVNVPVTVDFEGGYSDDDQKLASNITKLLELGSLGLISRTESSRERVFMALIGRQSALLRSAGQPSSEASRSSSTLGLTCFSATAATSRRHCEERRRTLELARPAFSSQG